MADDFKGNYGALQEPFRSSGELNIPTIAAANELAQRGQITNTEDTMRQRHVTAVSEELANRGMDPRRSRELTEKFLGGPSSPLFGAGLLDVIGVGGAYAIDEGISGYEKAEKPTDYIMPTIDTVFGVAETLFIGKLLAGPAKGFLKSLSSKLPAAGARADQRLSNMASGAVLSANPIGALGDVAVSTAGKVSKALTPKGIVPDRPIMPAPQRFFDKTNKDYKPFLSDFDFTEGGRYIEINKSGLTDVTAQQPAAARISVAGDGKPSMLISKELVDTTGSPSEKGSTLVKTNLFKKKAGWKWDKVPKGFDPDPSGDFPLVSVEAKGKHHYSINADFPAGVDLSRYANSKTEPRLRPTTKGKVTLGKKVGDISVRGKKHPVYDNIIVKSAAPIAIGAGALSELPEGSE